MMNKAICLQVAVLQRNKDWGAYSYPWEKLFFTFWIVFELALSEVILFQLDFSLCIYNGKKRVCLLVLLCFPIYQKRLQKFSGCRYQYPGNLCLFYWNNKTFQHYAHSLKETWNYITYRNCSRISVSVLYGLRRYKICYFINASKPILFSKNKKFDVHQNRKTDVNTVIKFNFIFLYLFFFLFAT